MIRRVAFLLILLFAAAASLMLAGRPGPAAGENEIVVLATASNRGEVDPCG